MKSKLIMGIMLAMLLMGMLQLAFKVQRARADDSWNITTVDSGVGGGFNSIALDSSGHPHISYYDNANSTYLDLKYAYYDGIWHTSTVDSGTVGYSTSIALDSSGYPHISYYDYANGDLKYAYYDGIWHTSTVDSGGDVGMYNSIALDSSGYPHISYYDNTNRDLKYAYYDGIWHTSTVDSGGVVGLDNSIALDSSGYPHISYIDFTNRDLKYAYYDGIWHTSTVDSGYVGAGTSIALDSSGYPHISYSANYGLTYAYYGAPPYDVTIQAYFYTESAPVSVSITMDGSPTGYNTPHTFTGLTGTHTFTVPTTDPNSHPFKKWSTGQTTTTITVTSTGTYAAYYEVAGVSIESNATLTQVGLSGGNLDFWANGITGKTYYVNVTMPVGLNTTEIKVFIDGNELTPPPFPIITTNGTHYFIYFEFIASTHKITIQFGAPAAVGGILVPVDKFALLAPYIALASTILIATAATTIYVKRRKKKQ
jgi:hypothetical protein